LVPHLFPPVKRGGILVFNPGRLHIVSVSLFVTPLFPLFRVGPFPPPLEISMVFWVPIKLVTRVFPALKPFFPAASFPHIFLVRRLQNQFFLTLDYPAQKYLFASVGPPGVLQLKHSSFPFLQKPYLCVAGNNPWAFGLFISFASQEFRPQSNSTFSFARVSIPPVLGAPEQIPCGPPPGFPIPSAIDCTL